VSTLYATKLVVPPPPPVTLRRSRLLDALDAAVQGPLTLVSAPAGAGKTALVSSWVGEGRAPGTGAWLSLGKEDNARRSFWYAVIAALEPVLGLAAPPRARIDLLLPALVAALSEEGDAVTLVLDDFHEVVDPAVTDDIQSLLDYPLARLRLVMLTRADPLLRLQRLRVAGRMGEIRARDLAFTLAETRELVRLLNLVLPEDDLDTLCRRTEGWAAGLRLAALSLEVDPDPHAFIDGFAGTDHAVSDYLMTEVISRQPDDRLRFLLATCVPDHVNGRLADALTEGHGGEDSLALMRRDGLIAPLDGRGGWYRYHPMFLEVLRLELARMLPDEVATLNRRAALWFSATGKTRDAINHAITARDWDLSGDLLGEHWLYLVIRGEGAWLRDAMDRIPPEVTMASAELALALGGLHLDAGLSGVDELLHVAATHADALPDERRRHFDIAATVTRLYRARMGGEVEEALRAARAVLDDNWDRSLSQDVRSMALTCLGTAEYWSGDVAAALEHLQQAVGLARECANDYLLFGAQAWAAAAAFRSDQLEETRRRAFSALEVAELRGWTKTAAAAVACLSLASLALLGNHQAAAAAYVTRAKGAIAAPEEPLLALEVALLEADLVAARGDALTGLDILRAAKSAAGESLPSFLRVTSALLEADLLMALGEPARARRLLVDLDANEDASDPAVGLARVELAGGAPEAAIRAVATFLADGRDAVSPAVRTDAWTLDAIARDELRDEEGALRALERALDIAEPRGFVRPLARHGAPVRSLLRRHIRRGTAHRALAGDVLAALDGTTAADRHTNGPLLEPLTERELAVLRFLPTMMSNTEIASEMFVSVNTVKTHLKHVYRKLDVTDRRDAVRRGRELRLLNPGLGDH
jgi:LuxR family maltose regulon positive regulatory protein